MTLLGEVTFLFVGLKLCGVIDWSWVTVTAPLWLPTLTFAGVLVAGRIVEAVGGK